MNNLLCLFEIKSAREFVESQYIVYVNIVKSARDFVESQYNNSVCKYC